MGIRIKPPFPRINWANPMTSGLIFDLPVPERGGTTTTDIVRGTNMTLVNGPTWEDNFLGSGISFSQPSSQYLSTSTPISTVRDNFTMQCVFYFASVSAGDGGEALFFYNGNDTGGGYGIGLNGRNIEFLFGGVARVTTGAAGDLDSNGKDIANIILCRRGGTTRIYKNGIDLGVTSSSTPNTPAQGTLVGAMLNNTTPYRYVNGNIMISRMWERALTDGEINALGSDPLLIYTRNYPTFSDTIAAVVSTFTPWRRMRGIGQ